MSTNATWCYDTQKHEVDTSFAELFLFAYRLTTANQSIEAFRKMGSQGRQIILFLAAIFIAGSAVAQSGATRISGSVLDPAGMSVVGAHVEVDSVSGARSTATSGRDGGFSIDLPAAGKYTVRVEAEGFAPVMYKMQLNVDTPNLTLRLQKISIAKEEIGINADVSQIDIASPDPSQKIMVREELLDANPGRPGAPISIPGLPIETAAGGIKAPQYFAPGVAGDHGEPIAQYIRVGGYLVPNNLSANAHGNGYADPNIYVSGALGGVSIDDGAYNVLEGNHSLNLAATYLLRPQLKRFVTLTGDYRDIDLTVGLAPSDPAKKAWLALEGNYGNGLMLTLEHRKQFKGNALRVFDREKHEITVFGDAYYGVSHEGNLAPVGFGMQVKDTVDRRQMDQTHTFILAANDQWKATAKDEVAFSGYLRTYNLTLFSNFGEGLIRQSEFRNAQGAEVRETHTFASWLEMMGGVLYNEDDIRNDNLDHYLADQPYVYGTFLKVLANDVTIREFAPYVALHGDLGKHLHFYAGLRNDQVQLINTDKMRAAYSFNEWSRFESPKVTATWSPGTGPTRWLPSASISLGQAFFTEDPRTNVAPSASGTGAAVFANPLERSHSLQVVLEKEFSGTDVRVTVSRTTTTATLAKIDPDNGSADDLGPSTIKFLTVNVRHQFSFGSLQGIVSKADARLATFNGVADTVTPEAPRTIFDVLTTLDKLPLGLHGRGEYEYVGHKFLDVGNAAHPGQYEAIPVGETRLALVRSFLDGRLELGVDGLVARGYTGQTTETFDPNWSVATSSTNLPYCAAGSGPSGLAKDFDCGTVERAVGIRMVSYIGGSISWRFGSTR
ncbi:TonB-dependent receptor [Acidicapsa ligni]|uniref:TonB-dependent receptor n=1 Tax=Acidicapsa ligni TaxID=542300 RepID=UPI0021E01179|nr:TonB-dependent receptor [Acidicapsa ligni]